MPSLAGLKRSFAAVMFHLHIRRAEMLLARADAHYDRAHEWRAYGEVA